MNHHTRTIALDLAKNVIQVCVIDHHGKVLSNQKMRRARLAQWLARQAPAIVAMEACSGAHHWGRLSEQLGHQACLIPPKQARNYRQGHKTDGTDALAVGVASKQPALKSVGVKTLEQQSVQSDKRVQEHLGRQVTATGNLLRALVAEFGVIIPKGKAALRRALPEILEDAENGLPMGMRESLALAWQSYRNLSAALERAEAIVAQRARQLEPCRRLQALPGVGAKNALGLYIRLGDGAHFDNARNAAACVGVSPAQHSSGGKTRIVGIGKHRGDRQLRSSLIVGARAAVNALKRRAARNETERWVQQLVERRGPARAAVALANKNVRTAWAMMRYGTEYQARPLTPNEAPDHPAVSTAA